MARTCDIPQCGQPATLVTITVARTVPGVGNKAKHDKHTVIHIELCDRHTDGIGLVIGDTVTGIRTGETPLPDLPAAETVDLTQSDAEAPAEHQETLLPLDAPAREVSDEIDAPPVTERMPPERPGKRHRA